MYASTYRFCVNQAENFEDLQLNRCNMKKNPPLLSFAFVYLLFQTNKTERS